MPETEKYKEIVRTTLPNLNSLRFIAALLVLIGHVNAGLQWNGYKSSNSFVFEFAPLSVVFFFVLSGFLITYLLLHEKEKREISVKKFYLKRILRIWPLYYLLIILSFAFLNHSKFFSWHLVTDTSTFTNHPGFYSILILFICPNIALLFTPSFGYATVAWSIGVEEQFYLLWPWIMKSRRPIVYIMVIILSVYLLSTGLLGRILQVINIPYKLSVVLWQVSNLFTKWFSFKIDAMAIGALGAFLAYHKSPLLKNVFNKGFQIFMYAVLLLLMAYGRYIPYQFFSIIFILIILNMAINNQNIFNLENRVFNYLGKISYGIYMLHMVTIMPAIYLCIFVFRLPQNIFTEILICFISLATTVAIASVSYRYFEGYFLKIKDKIATKKLQSGEKRIAAAFK